MLNFDKVKLNEVLRAFYNTTGARVAIYDLNENELIAYPKNFSLICYNLRKSKNIDCLCKKSDKKAFDICKKNKSSYVYECDMGLYEAVSPIIVNEKFVGFVMIGQIISGTSKKSVIDKTSKYIGLNEITNLIENSEIIQKNKLADISYLMNLCVEYLCSAQFILPSGNGKAKKIDEYIISNLDKSISINKVCYRFGISRTTLHNIMKDAYNMSASKRINYLKIDKAKRLLLEGLTVNSICEYLGFEDKNYFYRVFKEYAKKTVKEFLFDRE